MKPRAYYNDNDAKVCAWVRELIKRGLVMDGDVDERSIKDVKPDELKDYTRIHLFCGIAGWDYALQLAGWPNHVPVLTNSCPCQSFSNAGQRKGIDDPRHLWPDAFRLIRGLRPVTIFGEQVEAAIRFGWLDGVFTDLEGEGYSCGAAVLGAHSVGAPHIRQRIWWVADTRQRDGTSRRAEPESIQKSSPVWESNTEINQRCGEDDGLGESDRTGSQPGRETAAPNGHGNSAVSAGSSGRLANPISPNFIVGPEAQRQAELAGAGWQEYETRNCIDGKSRRTQPGICPLAHGVQARVVRLRGYGNAIVPQVAAEFIKASLPDS